MIKTLTLLALLPLCAFAQTANISRTEVDSAGITLNAQDAISPTYFKNDGRTLFYAKNNSGTAAELEFISQKASVYKDGYGAVSLGNQVMSVASGTSVLVGPFPTSRWNTTYGTVKVSSTVTGISVTAVNYGK